MNLSRLLVYIAVTAVSTYLIRVIPLVAIQKKIENRFFRSFLYYVPYAVLAAIMKKIECIIMDFMGQEI